MDFKKSRDHWAFLEEIEAPMWLDLTLDSKLNNEDSDDEWFYTSHPFHQSSSQQLKSAFSCSGEGTRGFDFDLQEQASPKLPSSVSRSRGKHYANRTWRDGNCDVPSNGQHTVKILSGNFSQDGSGFAKEIKPKVAKEIQPKLSFINSKGTSSSNVGLISETANTIGNHVGVKPKVAKEIQPKLSFTNSKGTSSSKITLISETGNANCSSGFGAIRSDSSSTLNMTGESNNTTSTITTESSHQHHLKFLEVSGQAFGNTSGLLSAVQITLRKSCVTRPASRVEITDERRESRERKSSSSKSSVGSSSNPCYDTKSSTSKFRFDKELTPESRNVARINAAAKNTTKVSDVLKASGVQPKAGNSDFRRRPVTNIEKLARKEVVKSKVQHQTVSGKSSLRHRVDEQNTIVGDAKNKHKGEARPNKLGSGKENAAGKTNMRLKCKGMDNDAAGMVRGLRGTKPIIAQKGERTRAICAKAKTGNQREEKISTNINQRVYFR